MKKTFLITMASCLTLGAANAAVIFSGTDGTLDFDAVSGSFSKGGITVTLAANDGVVNATSTGLGINDSGSGDDTNGLDTINLAEALTFTFDVDVIFNSITFSAVGTNDAVELSFNGAAPSTVATGGLASYNTTLLAGQTLVITAIAPNDPTPNNGVTIDQFTVTAVPEPSSFALLGLAGLATMLRRRR